MTPKDFFLHLGATIVLYAAAGALINLWFSVINYYNPDALAGYFYGNTVAWPISMLIVLVPTLYVLEWLIGRDIARLSEKASLAIRKWRIYVTIFLAAALLIGDLIALINVYLNGEITSRFLWKILVILVLSGLVGMHYFYSLYPQLKLSSLVRRVAPWAGIALVLGAVVMGFIAVGSPATQRALRFDNQRVNDLSTIQWQVINYWQTKETLPPTLADAIDPIYGIKLSKDPETKADYEYRVISNDIPNKNISFELCATFSRPTQDTEGRGEFGYGRGGFGVAYPAYDSIAIGYPGDGQDVWKHEAGRTCFMRTIDPDRFPSIKPASER